MSPPLLVLLLHSQLPSHRLGLEARNHLPGRGNKAVTDSASLRPQRGVSPIARLTAAPGTACRKDELQHEGKARHRLCDQKNTSSGGSGCTHRRHQVKDQPQQSWTMSRGSCFEQEIKPRGAAMKLQPTCSQQLPLPSRFPCRQRRLGPCRPAALRGGLLILTKQTCNTTNGKACTGAGHHVKRDKKLKRIQGQSGKPAELDLLVKTGMAIS